MASKLVYLYKTGSQITSAPPIPWRVKGILPAQGLAAIFGPSTAGKSFLALDLAASIALGNDWFGHRVKQAPVTYVVLEGEGGFARRIKAWEKYNEHGLPCSLQFVTEQPFQLNLREHVEALAEGIPKGSVIIIDTLNRSSPDADENTSKDMGLILAGAKLLQTLTQGLVILIHHTGKDETRGLRGHSSLIAAIDASIEVKRNEDVRSWTVAKAKDGQDGYEFGFRLAIEDLGTDEDGDTVTSCAIEPMSSLPQTPRSLGKNQKAALAALEPHLVDGPIPLEQAIAIIASTLEHIEPKRRNERAKLAIESLLNSNKLIRNDGQISRA